MTKSKLSLGTTLSFVAVLSSAPNANVLAQEARHLGGMMKRPTSKPSDKPSGRPSTNPSKTPSAPPSAHPSKTPSTPPSAIPSVFPSSMPSQQCHPLDTLYDRFIQSVRQCEAGADLSEAQEAYLSTQVSNLVDNLSNCIHDEIAVKKAIANNQELILLCPDTYIELSSPISISGKQFEMRCLRAPSSTETGEPSCVFSGKSTIRLFGRDLNGHDVKFHGIRFTSGVADSSYPYGGVFDFDGGAGRAEFDFCQFDNNKSYNSGGVMEIRGAGSVVVVTNSVFKDNQALNGGAISVLGDSSKLIIGTTTFSGNSASYVGPDILAYSVDVVLCSFGNSFPTGANEITIYENGYPAFSCTH